jgi:hypothetical protein
MQSIRVEMKKLTDARSPFTMLKFKMQLKAEANESYRIFHDELEQMVQEQNKFFASCELLVAKIEQLDTVQAMVLKIPLPQLTPSLCRSFAMQNSFCDHSSRDVSVRYSCSSHMHMAVCVDVMLCVLAYMCADT